MNGGLFGFSKAALRGFTLIEILIVVGIVGVLSAAAIIFINPLELLAQTRDGVRLSHLETIDQALSHYAFQVPSGSLGTPNVLYVSLPDPAATTTAGTACTSLDLPSLPAGWVYHCAGPNEYRKTDGTGWVPVNFAESPTGATIGALPVDPTNDAALRIYYTYSVDANKKWELNARMQSVKYKEGGTRDATSVDGGSDPTVYEKGSNLAVAPEGSGGLGEGGIDSTYKYAWSENIGWIDFYTTGNVKVNSTQMKGYASSSNIGYIALDCATSPNGNICGTSNFKVENEGGTLSGYAWNDETGWISFNCTDEGVCGTSNYAVTISATGTFSGWAWSENIGWISFNCQNDASCGSSNYKVITTWSP